MHRLAATDAHEGPVVLGDQLYFSSLPARPGATSIRRVPLAGGAVETVVADANGANGMTAARDGRLVVCEQGGPGADARAAITLVDPATGAREVVADAFEGRPFNSPNDVCVGADGAVFFTDPTYGWRQGFRPPPALPPQVYRWDPGTRAVRVVATGFEQPNGLALSADGSALFVADSAAGRLWSIDLAGAGRRELAGFEGEHPDGLKVGADGRLYASSVRGVDVLAPDGRRLDTLEVPGAVNFWLHERELFVTTDDAVWVVGLPAPHPSGT